MIYLILKMKIIEYSECGILNPLSVLTTKGVQDKYGTGFTGWSSHV